MNKSKIRIFKGINIVRSETRPRIWFLPIKTLESPNLNFLLKIIKL